MRILLFLLIATGLFILGRSYLAGRTASAALIAEPLKSGVFTANMKPPVRGLTMVAPPEPFPSNPFTHVQEVGANWIAVVPYAFTQQGKPTVKYDVLGMQWWGEKPVGVKETIRLAKEHHVSVMLKPQVYIHNGWTGNLDFETDADWESWESQYRDYIMLMAGIAQETQAEMFCIGTEFRVSVTKRPAFWQTLISDIRKVYQGKLTYSANWDDWDQVPFYAELDYIGMSAYYPLHDAQTPDIDSLCVAWKPIVAKMEAFHKKMQKPILFTEYGYLSVDGCGGRNWELEQRINDLAINQEAQARCYTAMFKTFSEKSWWAGGFLWKWFPNMRGHEGYPEKDYTPQGKAGELALKAFYKGNSDK
jgi:hypothetical protein